MFSSPVSSSSHICGVELQVKCKHKKGLDAEESLAPASSPMKQKTGLAWLAHLLLRFGSVFHKVDLYLTSTSPPCPVPGPLHKMQPHPILDPSRCSKHSSTGRESPGIGQSSDPGATCEQAPHPSGTLALHTTSKTPGDFDVGPGIRKRDGSRNSKDLEKSLADGGGTGAA